MATLTYLQAIILGIVQGLGEFLPISSSGHLAILEHFFDIKGDSVLLFAVLLHMGTLLSVLVIYRRDIIALCRELALTIKDIVTGKGPRINSSPERRLGFMILVATIPTGLMGVLFNDVFTGFYQSLTAIGIGLLITGTLLWFAERMGRGRCQVEKMKFRHELAAELETYEEHEKDGTYYKLLGDVSSNLGLIDEANDFWSKARKLPIDDLTRIELKTTMLKES